MRGILLFNFASKFAILAVKPWSQVTFNYGRSYMYLMQKYSKNSTYVTVIYASRRLRVFQGDVIHPYPTNISHHLKLTQNWYSFISWISTESLTLLVISVKESVSYHSQEWNKTSISTSDVQDVTKLGCSNFYFSWAFYLKSAPASGGFLNPHKIAMETIFKSGKF